MEILDELLNHVLIGQLKPFCFMAAFGRELNDFD
jgi:hypothetical protein